MKIEFDSGALPLYSIAMQDAHTSASFETERGSAILGEMTDESRKEFVTTTEAAEILGVHRSRIFPLIRSGRIDAQKYGPMWLIRLSSLDNVRERRAGYPKGRKRKPD